MDSALILVLTGVACFALGVVLASMYWRRRMAAEVQVAKNDTAYWRALANEQRLVPQTETDFDIFNSSPTQPG